MINIGAAEIGFWHAKCRFCCQSTPSSSECSLEAEPLLQAGLPPSTVGQGEPAQHKGQITGSPLPLFCSQVLHKKGKKTLIFRLGGGGEEEGSYFLASILPFPLNCSFSYAFISNIYLLDLIVNIHWMPHYG